MFVAIVPWTVLLVIWGLMAVLMFTVAAVMILIGIVLLPFRVGLGILNLALQIFLWPFSMLTGRRWR